MLAQVVLRHNLIFKQIKLPRVQTRPEDPGAPALHEYVFCRSSSHS